MRLNYDLIRELLLFIEEETDGITGNPALHYVNAFPIYSPNIVEYHVKYLIDSRMVETKGIGIIDITPYGRDYLNNVRNHSIWDFVKTKIQPLESVPVDVIASVAKACISSKLGL